jgi:hypothetical protein
MMQTIEPKKMSIPARSAIVVPVVGRGREISPAAADPDHERRRHFTVIRCAMPEGVLRSAESSGAPGGSRALQANPLDHAD